MHGEQIARGAPEGGMSRAANLASILCNKTAPILSSSTVSG